MDVDTLLAVIFGAVCEFQKVADQAAVDQSGCSYHCNLDAYAGFGLALAV